MDEKHSRKNILLYILYVVFNEPLFWGPILVTTLQHLAGMSLPEIYYMESIVLLLCVALDIPSGALADVIGRRKTVLIGRVFLLGSITVFAFMTNATEAWIGNILWAIGYTFQSGPDNSLLYETLQRSGKENLYTRIQGRTVAGKLFLLACGSLVAGYLAETDLRFPVYLCIPFMVIPLIATFFMKESVPTERYSVTAQVETLVQGGLFVFHSVEVRWLVCFAALIASTSKAWFFTYNPYFELVGIPLSEVGKIFFVLGIVAGVSSFFASQIEKMLGEKRCVGVTILCVSVPIILMGTIPLWPLAYLVIVQNVVRGFMRPFTEDYVHHHITLKGDTRTIRATVMSAQTAVSNIVSALALALFGFLEGSLGLLHALTLLGVITLILGGLCYVWYVKKIA